MNDYILKKPDCFYVIGIDGRTTNKAEFEGKGIIPGLWQKFMSESILSLIPNKIDNDIIVCYYDYESDYRGEYSYLIGARVSTLDEIPEGMSALCVPPLQYAVFTTDEGKVVEQNIKTWQHIWHLEDTGQLPRSYYIDYEVWDARSHDHNNGQIDIYIGI
jgi:predicted transcriptional regulator YdeE